MFTIETPRLILRDVLESDLEAFFQLGSDPAVCQFQHYIRVQDENAARQWLQNAVAGNQELPRKGYNLAILRKPDMALVGWIGFGEAEDRSIADIEFGYAVRAQYRGEGYASEAARGVLAFCFTELGVGKVFGECDRENHASARVLEKAGLHWQASVTEIDPAGGEPHEVLRYVITAQAWRGQPRGASGSGDA
jgi:ribosomal-protein-alanine N-acetyltransferase